MKTVVFCGSPKGVNSITLQTVRYLSVKFPEDEFSLFDVSAASSVTDEGMRKIAAALEDADSVLFAYPVYSFGVPSQMMRAVEEMKARFLPFAGKWCTQLTTSMKVLDPLAHEWVAQNAQDMGMRVVPGLSSGQEDLPTESGRAQAEAFWRYFRAAAGGRLDAPAAADDPKRFRTLILADLQPDDHSLAEMIDAFRSVYPYETEICNVGELGLRGGCLGCLKCSPEGHCVYTDGFEELFRSSHMEADATVVAFSVRNHGIGWRLKRYFDRTYFNGHRAPEKRSSIGYLVCGDMSQEDNLKTYLNAYTQFRHTRDCGICASSDGDGAVAALAARMQYSLENDYLLPRNFYGEACMTMFRDIVTELRGVMRADYRYFRSHGLLNFSETRTERIKKSMQAGMLLSSPELQREMGLTFEQAMCKEHCDVVAAAVVGGLVGGLPGR